MKATIIIISLVVLALLAGCQSKDQTTGYATYSGGQAGGEVGGGGCGRFADSSGDFICPEIVESEAGHSEEL